MKSGIEIIAAERRRQLEVEGFSTTRDSQYVNGELAAAASCYSAPEHMRRVGRGLPYNWPWSWDWWKPTPDDRIRELAKAGALIAAEIDRLQQVENGKMGGE